MNFWKILLLILGTGHFATACSNDDDNSLFTEVDNYFLSFSLKSNDGVWRAVMLDNEIIVTVPEGTLLNDVQVSYTLSGQATVTPEPAMVTDWNKDQLFTVSNNGIIRTYEYKVRYSATGEAGTFILNSQAEVDAFARHPSTVVEGGLSIGTELDIDDPIFNLNGLAKVTEIIGNINIGQYYKGENLAGLAKLEKTGSFSVVYNSSLIEFELPGLLSILGELNIENPSLNLIGSIKCPRLTTISKRCYIQAPNIESLNFNSLESIPGAGDNSEADGTFTLNGSRLTSFELPALKEIGTGFVLLGEGKHPELALINLPELTSCKNISIGNADKLETIHFPKLTTTLDELYITLCPEFSRVNETIEPLNMKRLSMTYCSGVTALDVSQKDIDSITIAHVGEDFILKGKEVMANYSFAGDRLPKTEGISSFASLIVNTMTPDIEITGIQQVTGELRFRSNRPNVTLRSVSMPDLVTVGSFVANNKYKNVSFPKLTEVTEQLRLDISTTATDLSHMDFQRLKSVEYLDLNGGTNSNITSLDGYFPALSTLKRIRITSLIGLYDFSPFKKFADAMTEASQWQVNNCGPGTVTLEQMKSSANGDFTPDN